MTETAVTRQPVAIGAATTAVVVGGRGKEKERRGQQEEGRQSDRPRQLRKRMEGDAGGADANRQEWQGERGGRRESGGREKVRFEAVTAEAETAASTCWGSSRSKQRHRRLGSMAGLSAGAASRCGEP